MSYCQWYLWAPCFSLSEEIVSVVAGNGAACWVRSGNGVASRCNRIQTFRRNVLASSSKAFKSWKNRDDAIGLPIEARRILKELNPCLHQWDSLEPSLHGLNVFFTRYRFSMFRHTTPSGGRCSCYHNPVQWSVVWYNGPLDRVITATKTPWWFLVWW